MNYDIQPHQNYHCGATHPCSKLVHLLSKNIGVYSRPYGLIQTLRLCVLGHLSKYVHGLTSVSLITKELLGFSCCMNVKEEVANPGSAVALLE